MKILWFLALPVLLVSAGCKKSETTPKSSTGGSASEAPSEASLADDGTATALRVKWPAGNRYTERMEMTGDTETFMPMSSKPMVQKVGLNQEYSITVVGQRPQSGPELELEFESTEIDVSMNGKAVMNLDTKAEAGPESADPVSSSFRQVIGAKIKFLLDASNRVEKVEGVKEFIAKAGAGNPQSRAQMQSMFSEDYFKQLVDFQRGLPLNPVKVGESWPVKTELGSPVGVLNLDINYTFAGWEQREKRKCAAIDFTGTMSSKEAASPGAGPMGMTMKMESGKLSGKSWFDPALGHPVEILMHQDMVLHMKMPRPRSGADAAGAQAAAYQSITNNAKQKIVIKLVEVVSPGR